MKRKKFLAIFKIINILSLVMFSVVIYFIYPLFIKINNNVKYIIGWLFVLAVVEIYFNHLNIDLISRVKDNANISDLFNLFGRIKVKQNPEKYFEMEDYVKYKNNLRNMFIYFLFSMLILFLISFIYL